MKHSSQDLRAKSAKELTDTIKELHVEYTRAKLEKQSGKYEGTRIKLLGDAIARAKTILREKELSPTQDSEVKE